MLSDDILEQIRAEIAHSRRCDLEPALHVDGKAEQLVPRQRH